MGRRIDAGIALLLLAAAVPVAAQTTGMHITSYQPEPGPNPTVVYIENLSPPGSQSTELFLPAIGHYGLASGANQVVRAAAVVQSTPAATSAAFGFDPPTSVSGWPGGTEWRDAASNLFATSVFNEVVTASASASATVNIYFDLTIRSLFSVDLDLAGAAAESLIGLSSIPSNALLSRASTAANANLTIRDVPLSDTYAGMAVSFGIGSTLIANTLGDPVSEIFSLEAGNFGGMTTHIYDVVNGVPVSGVYVTKPISINIFYRDEVFDSVGNLVAYTVEQTFGLRSNYRFPFQFIEGRSYSFIMGITCNAGLTGMANFMDDNSATCMADRSTYWNGVTDVRDAGGKRLTNFTLLSESGVDFRSASPLSPAPAIDSVPEPATWALLIAGFGLVGAAARRRRAACHGIVRMAALS